MSVARMKSGLYSAASVAASGAASQASNAAAKVAATTTAYVGQSMWGKPSPPHYDHDFAEGDAMMPWQPPLNRFNHQGKQGRNATGASAVGSSPSLGTHQRHSKECTGVKFDEAEVHYHPPGLSNEWHCMAAKCE